MALDNRQIGLYFIIFLLIIVVMLRYGCSFCNRDRDNDDYHDFEINDDNHDTTIIEINDDSSEFKR